MQWSSVVMGYGGSHVAFIDIEQVNAVAFLFCRMAWVERPIFSFIEFMIRAAETFYDDGDVALAASIGERASDRLWEYCRHHDAGDGVPRPMAIDDLLPAILDARLIPSFIAGHEIGHLMHLRGDPGPRALFDWIYERYHAINSTQGAIPFERFLEPEVTQKFTVDGVPNGFSILTTKFARQMLHMRQQQIQEAQADALGVVVTTEAAIKAGIPVEVLFGFFPKILEYSDLLMMLRRTVARLPRGEKAGSVASERSSLFARLCLYVELVRGLRAGEVDAPPEVMHFWSELPEESVATMLAAAEDGRLEALAMRSAIFCRGGVEVGLYGRLADPLPEEYRDLGPFAGNLSMAHAHRQIPEWFFRIEDSFDWEASEHGPDAVAYGFAAAIREVTELSASETRPLMEIRRRDIVRDGRDDAFIELLRGSRRQTVARHLDTWWVGFEAILRRAH